MRRDSFSRDWKFWRDENPFELVAAVPPTAVAIDLPHDAMWHEAQDPACVNGGQHRLPGRESL